MVVIHAVSSLNMGGAERFVIDLSWVQKEQGLTPIILSMGSETEPLVSEARSRGFDVVHVAGGPVRRSLAVLRLLSKRKAKILHIHSPMVLKSLALALPLLALRCRIVYTRHGVAPLAAKHWLRLHRWARRFVSRVTFVSNASQNAFHAVHQWPVAMQRVIDNGVLLAVQQKPPKRDGALRLGCVGRLVELKGQRYLIEVLGSSAQALPATTELHIFGDGPQRGEYEALAASQSVADRVTFHGNVIDREAVYASFDILVVCSESEGLSLAIMEAMAQGMPVIATDVGGNSQLVLDEVTGLLVPYADTGALGHAVRRLLSDPVLAARMGAEGRQRIVEHFSLERTATAYGEVYDLPIKSRG